MRPSRRPASRDSGTMPRLRSLIWRPPSEFGLTFRAVIVWALIWRPEIFTAAQEVPPIAMKTASVAITFA